MTNVPNQFTIPSIDMVPKHFIPMSHVKAAADAETTALSINQYVKLLARMNKGTIPSLRVNSSRKLMTPLGRAPSGRLFFDPKFAIPRLMTATQIQVIKDLSLLRVEHGMGLCSRASDEYRRQVSVVIQAFQESYPAHARIRKAMKSAAPFVDVQEALVEVMPSDALTAKTNAPDELLVQLAGNSDATLCAIRENTAVMRQLLAVWTGSASANT